MVVGIKNISRGRFGNRVFHYNNLLQICKKYNCDIFCDKWEGNDWFESDINFKSVDSSVHNLKIDDFKNGTYKEYLDNNISFSINGLVIHNLFFELTEVEPKKLIKIKKEFLPSFRDSTVNLGIHIRGGDILYSDNRREVHTLEYYINAVNEVLKDSKIDSIHICTDDLSFELVGKVFDFCKSVVGDDKVHYGKSTINNEIPHIYDFALLSECDYLIAGSSTYSSSAAILGKNKKIIHSLDWLKKTLPGDTYVHYGKYTEEYPESYWRSFDSFWVKIYNGGNKFYKPWKIV